MIKLYGHVNRKSPNTLKLRVALAEAGARYEYVVVNLDAGEQKRPEFLALNPHGKIPVLVDGAFVLPESDAILWYIAETFPEAKLLTAAAGAAGAAGAQARARVLQWCDFSSTGLYHAYLAGEFSIADLAAATVLQTVKTRIPRDPSADRPHITDWYARVAARPAW